MDPCLCGWGGGGWGLSDQMTSAWFMDSASIMLLLFLFWIVPILVCLDSNVSLREHRIMSFSRGTHNSNDVMCNISLEYICPTILDQKFTTRGFNYNNLTYVTTANSSISKHYRSHSCYVYGQIIILIHSLSSGFVIKDGKYGIKWFDDLHLPNMFVNVIIYT